MNVIFMGTPEFSVPVLQGLIDSEEHTVTAVVTQPDKARGRSGKLVFTPVKVKDPEFVDTLRQIPCDVIVVVAFGQILSKDILDMPTYGCINVHASLLPRWRGAAPMQWAILEGGDKTGVTTMQMAEGLDTGDMLLKAETPIEADDTAETLHDRMSVMGKELLLKTLDALLKGELTPVPQKDEESCYAKMLTKDLGKISMNWNAEKLERYIRGLNSWPSAYTTWKGKTLKLWRAKVISGNTEEAPGTIVEVGKNSFTIQTGDGKLEILEVQLEGKKRMDDGSFLRGVSVEKGDVLC